MRSCRQPAACQVLLAVALLLTAGCGNTDVKPPEVMETIYYPKAPDLPRLQFLTSFSDTETWVGDKADDEGGSTFSDFLFGKEAGKSTIVRFSMPYGLGARDGKLYICDLGRKMVHVLDLKNRTHSRLGEKGQIKRPVNITFGPNGRAYVCDTKIGKVAVFDAQDKFVRYMGDPKKCVPIDLEILGDELIVADVANAEVEVWDSEGKFLQVLARKGNLPGQLKVPSNLAITSEGHILVSDTAASIINVYNRKGTYLRSVGAPGDRAGFFARPKGLAIDDSGIVYTVDAHWQYVQLFSPEGGLLMYFGGPKPTPDGLSIPAGIIVDKTLLPMFQSYVDPDFKAEYLVFLTNQYGNNKICVYAFGKSKTGKYVPLKHDPKALKPPPPPSGDGGIPSKESGSDKPPATP